MLGRAHCRVRTAFTLMDGMKSLDSPPFPDVVILDLMLPRGDGTSDPGDGVDILRKIREENINARVIIVTGRPMDQIDYVRELKPFAVFKKPVNFRNQLYPAVRGVAK
jgi:DNA-binding response OmpR family regulator